MKQVIFCWDGWDARCWKSEAAGACDTLGKFGWAPCPEPHSAAGTHSLRHARKTEEPPPWCGIESAQPGCADRLIRSGLPLLKVLRDGHWRRFSRRLVTFPLHRVTPALHACHVKKICFGNSPCGARRYFISACSGRKKCSIFLLDAAVSYGSFPSLYASMQHRNSFIEPAVHRLNFSSSRARFSFFGQCPSMAVAGGGAS